MFRNKIGKRKNLNSLGIVHDTIKSKGLLVEKIAFLVYKIKKVNNFWMQDGRTNSFHDVLRVNREIQ